MIFGLCPNDLSGGVKRNMENLEAKTVDSSQCVRVAVNIRPLITSELLLGCTDCISVVPGEPQVQIYIYIYIYFFFFKFCN